MEVKEEKSIDVSCSRRIAIACAALGFFGSVTWAPASAADEAAANPASARPSTAEEKPASGAVAPHGQEDSATKEWWDRDQLTGNWGGLLDDLHEHGIKPQVKFSQFAQGVEHGGVQRNGAYGGKVDYFLDVDVSKFASLWPGLFFNLHAETQYGKSVIADAGPSALPNSPMVVPLPNCDCTEVTNLTLMQGLWEGTIPLQDDKGAVVAAAGKLAIIDLLTTSFPNFGYGLEGFLNYSALYPAWPYLRFWYISQYGATVALFNEDRGMPQISFLVYGQDNVSDKWDISDSFSDGVGLMGLFRVFWDLGDKPGYAAVLATGSTKEYSVIDDIVWEPSFLPGGRPDPGIQRETGNPWAVNPFLYQEFWHAADGEDERKAYVWLTGALADKKPSFTRWGILGTVEAMGPLACRPRDRAGFAGWFTAWNDNHRKELRLLGVSARNVFGFEMYYNLAINQWLHLTADLQLVQNLDKADDLAVIPGGRLVMNF